MRRSAWIFLAAILLPSLALAWLAVRSARDQQVILEHQQAIISQNITDALARRVQDKVEESRSVFIQTTQNLLKQKGSARPLAENFNQELLGAWDTAEVGFAVDLNGKIYSPKPQQSAVAGVFRKENDRFLSNRENVPVFAQNAQQTFALNSNNTANSQPVTTKDKAISQSGLVNNPPNPNQAAQSSQQAQRLVVPQQAANPQRVAVYNTLPADSNFRKLIGTQSSGALARLLEDKLRLMVWYRPPEPGSLVLGAQISQEKLVASLQPLLDSIGPDSDPKGAYCIAILDDRGKPAVTSRTRPCPAGERRNWKHPFVATEIGEALPHWEAALYLVDPQAISRSASTLQLTLGLIVLTLFAAILLGVWLMAADVRRQMRLAQQKTDFVSNVSHELKTPLTSIRMFADMLAEGRVTEPARQASYLRIISAESARLTRLINNVLDFARMQRGAPARERRICDLVEVVREVVDTCRPHLESEAVSLAVEINAEKLPLLGDRDALAQIVMNLLSNAEKYGRGEILVRVRRLDNQGWVDVLDRGPGVPARKLETIFQPFTRLDESQASGVSGSGLGLTLARGMAQAHGGDVTYSPREGGGSCFTLCVSLNAAGGVQ
ncbi:MAG TPA: HAMP domain-containing sensor histidine kinase [Verrucomicrobiae bacterium]|jgi:signal transduction histidine kinase|nr:HAMP domain-containing sensor histidine kinase [Verrucomicrobiae bacterium]